MPSTEIIVATTYYQPITLHLMLGRLRPMGSLFGSFPPRGARSKGDQQPDGRVAHNQKLQASFGPGIGSLTTRVLRARKTRK